jgi:Na+/proline symporter/signal transduction histidine kinase
VASIAIVGSIPYIALQLKAVSSSLATILTPVAGEAPSVQPVFGDLAMFVALSMAAFAVLFGTRHADATEHQDGLMLAVATESIVKLVAFLAVGSFVTFVLFDGPAHLLAQAAQQGRGAAVLTHAFSGSEFAAMTLLSLFAALLLPRQFHVAVVENGSEKEIRRAAWWFPLYLVLINLFVIPIALAGLLTFPAGHIDGDMFVLALPLAARSDLMAIVAFVGGLSAATAMVIVETVALSIMVSNDIVVPLVLKRREAFLTGRGDAGAMLLAVRRVAIFVILLLAYMYYQSAGDAQLAAIGLLSFAAIAQLAPAFFGGLVWRRATARGAMAGMIAGVLIWAYTLLLPSFADAGIIGQSIVTDGPGGIVLLRPQALFGIDLPPLVHGVIISLAVNLAAYLGVSLRSRPAPIEQLQANLFVPSELSPMAPNFRLWRSSVTVAELTSTVSGYLGEERARASFTSFAANRRIDLEPDNEAPIELLRHAEHVLASAIGAASSRLVLSLLLRKRAPSAKAALKLLDDANTAIHYNREILQTALDHVRQGIAVFDKELRLICWNRQFGELLDLPAGLTNIGVALDKILRFTVDRDAAHPDAAALDIGERMQRYVSGGEPFLERFTGRDLVIEVRSNRMPDGGIVTTFTDITPSVAAAEALAQANETLERRVHQRTEELTRLNAALADAKREAEEANISKTRFLAAASHDILQPLNAARLYVTSLIERQGGGEDARLIHNIDASLDAVEEIFGGLLEMSRLDSGAMKPEIINFRVVELLDQLELEFAPLARSRGLDLTFVRCGASLRSDRRLLRRLLQNLISNAIKYTISGRVLVGCRGRGSTLRIEVHDTGLGIPRSKQRAIFTEFHRLDHGARIARGLGLGLSIVERIGRVLDHRISVRSATGRGSCFSVEVPLSPAIPIARTRSAATRPDPRQMADTTLLCIDNDPAILDGMEALLCGWGCRCLKAANLAGAMAAVDAATLTPDALLVDYHLDSGNGLDAIRTLRARFGTGLPAILITADRSPSVRSAARRSGVQVLNKPVKPAALRALLAQSRTQRVVAAE